jgi:hypothetical protein
VLTHLVGRCTELHDIVEAKGPWGTNRAGVLDLIQMANEKHQCKRDFI